MEATTLATPLATNLARPGAPAIHLRPRFRGVSHQWAFFVSLIAGALLVASATHALGAVASVIYAVSLSGLLGTSALYHRIPWTCPVKRGRMGRVDHAMIFVLIAGTYTPFSLLGLLGSASTFLLILSWSLAGLGSILTIFWYDQPKWLIAVLYIAVGWVAVFSFGPLLSAIGLGGLALVVAGGVLYSVGALIYGFRRPDPHPRIFGYHEVFHAFVLAGAGAHFLAIFLRVPL